MMDLEFLMCLDQNLFDVIFCINYFY